MIMGAKQRSRNILEPRTTLRLVTSMDNLLLPHWQAWMEAQGLSPRTIEHRTRVIRHFTQTADPLNFTPADVIMFVGRRGLSAWSRVSYHQALSAYSLWLVKTKRRPDNPTLETPSPRNPKGVPRPVTPVELPSILAHCDRKAGRMMVLLAALQGLRVHEIAKIRGEHLDLNDMSLVVTGKGGKTAILPLHGTVAHLARVFPAEGFWFPSKRPEGHILPASVSTVIKRAMNKAGVDKTAHQLRHYFGTTLVQNGVDLRTVQELLRHESLATTQIYTQVNSTQKRNAIDGLNMAS